MRRESGAERVARLLALVAYLAEREGASVEDLARHFDVSPAQILRDVDTLWVSGTPGYQPGDLLDFSADSYDRGYIALTDARRMDRPLRLGLSEATALVVALEAMRSLPGLDRDAVTSTLEALRAGVGEAGRASEVVVLDAGADHLAEHVADVLETARAALRARRRLELVYVGASDVRTQRVVEPIVLTNDGEHWYLRAWCLRADGVRHFRLDRVVSAQVLEDPTQGFGADLPALGARPEPSAAGSVNGARQVRLALTPRSRWVAERFGGRVEREGSEEIVVALDVVDEAWFDALLLRLGPDLRAVEPPAAAARVAARARAALAVYEAEAVSLSRACEGVSEADQTTQAASTAGVRDDGARCGG